MTPTSTHRISSLLGVAVVTSDGSPMGVVKDIRLGPTRQAAGPETELMVAGLVVGKRHTGALLGYDRQPTQGPWLVRIIVRSLHRDSGFLPWNVIRDIDWSAGVVHSNLDHLEPLAKATTAPPEAS
jgi:sporulation protein YlmC with PRC-barrel domain